MAQTMQTLQERGWRVTTCKETGEAELSRSVSSCDGMQRVSITDGCIEVWDGNMGIMADDAKLIVELAIELRKGKEI